MLISLKLLNYVFDITTFSSLTDYVSLGEYYERLIFKGLGKSTSVLFRNFQLRVKGNVFIDIFTKFKIFGLLLITIVRISKLFTIIIYKVLKKEVKDSDQIFY